MTSRDLPKPLYSCQECAEDYSWPAEDLAWYDLDDHPDYESGWYCPNCSDNLRPEDQPVIGLKSELEQRGLNR